MNELRWRGSRELRDDPFFRCVRFRSYWLIAWASHDGPHFKWQASLPGRIIAIGRASSLHDAQANCENWVRYRTEWHLLGTPPALQPGHDPNRDS